MPALLMYACWECSTEDCAKALSRFFRASYLQSFRKSHQSGYLPFVADFRIHSVNRRVNDHHSALLMKSVFAQLPSKLL